MERSIEADGWQEAVLRNDVLVLVNLTLSSRVDGPGSVEIHHFHIFFV